MASVLGKKSVEKKDPAKIQAEADEIYKKRKESERVIVSGQHAGNKVAMTPGDIVRIRDDGTIRLNDTGDPSSIYKWNERTGDYRSHGGGILSVGTVPALAESGSGGGGGEEPARQSTGSVVYPDGSGEILDTNPTGGYASWQQQMANYYPTTPNQALNPLVDPNQWMHTPNPAYGILNNPGVYVNNPQPIGVLV